jgi:hypothetical protein
MVQLEIVYSKGFWHGGLMLSNLAWLASAMLTKSFILSSLAFKALKMDQEVHYFFVLQQKWYLLVWPFPSGA